MRSLRMRWRECAPEVRDLVAVVVVTMVSVVVVINLDLNERWVEWTRSLSMEELLDPEELPMAFTTIAFGVAWFAYRRWRQYRAEARAHDHTIAELREAVERAQAANQAKAQFLAAMSHELRTPLNAVLGFAEIIRDQSFGLDAGERYAEYAGDIFTSGTHLLSIVNDILEMARSEVGVLRFEQEAVEVAQLFGEVTRMITERAREGRVAVVVEEGPPVIAWADPDKLRQSLLNVAFNAVKFTPPGGLVTLRCRCHAECAVIEIADTGIGIAEADIAKALTPFAQVDDALSRRYGGAGLGLPLAKAYVEQQGGALSLASTVGQGTTVTIRLPLAECAACRASAPPHALAHEGEVVKGVTAD